MATIGGARYAFFGVRPGMPREHMRRPSRSPSRPKRLARGERRSATEDIGMRTVHKDLQRATKLVNECLQRDERSGRDPGREPMRPRRQERDRGGNERTRHRRASPDTSIAHPRAGRSHRYGSAEGHKGRGGRSRSRMRNPIRFEERSRSASAAPRKRVNSTSLLFAVKLRELNLVT